MEKEYTVIVHNRDDLSDIEAEITASSGAGPIPNRTVDVANPRLGSKIQTHFMLTDEEATALEADDRIRAVEIPPDQRDDIELVLNAYQDSNFYRGSQGLNNEVNWGLPRCIRDLNSFGNTQDWNFVKNNAPNTGFFEYGLDGLGVDVVTQDSGLQVDHPEFIQDGVSRVEQINWYTASGLAGTQSPDHYRDYDGHGTHCAGIACGKTYGWAKRAKVYAQKLGGLEGAGDAGTGIPITDAFDTIRLWHNQKGTTATGYKRPTVVNMSWGYQGTAVGDPVSGVYRGQAWNFGDVGYTSDTEVWASSGVVPPLGQFRRFTSQVASVDAEIEDMVSDGIVVCIASGNSYYKSDVTGGPDFDNQVTMSNGTRFYHRPGSPYASTALYVGNIDSTTQTEIVDGVTVYHDRPAASSVRGPAVDIWAPGSSIMSCASNFNNTFNYTQYDYPDNDAFKIMSIGGTSMASPQIAGIAALHLGSKPWMTPAQVKAVLLGDSTSVISSTGLIDDYTNSTTSLMGGENAHTVCRYGKQPLHYGGTPDDSLNGFIISQNGNDYHHYHLDATPTSDIEGATVVVTLTTIGVDDGTLVPYTITGVQAADIQGGSLVGNFNVVSGTATATFTFLQDTVTEEDEILKLTLDSQRAHVEITIEANTT